MFHPTDRKPPCPISTFGLFFAILVSGLLVVLLVMTVVVNR